MERGSSEPLFYVCHFATFACPAIGGVRRTGVTRACKFHSSLFASLPQSLKDQGFQVLSARYYPARFSSATA